ncbi:MULTISPECIES: substrate-binding domain-containing protein [Pseudofrankia]|uniref:substrate-binding domain-containing protein n=1 Tax=Pseudofrankia TaxID=2994363 RepID=UPI000234D5AC|nr:MULTISPECIES: substrate-binding domain-containing protein [Pseudofrankia]OHV31896.1 sugar ABC transporter substrate-binding protein [Pseudofrankia sp. EUN1h]
MAQLRGTSLGRRRFLAGGAALGVAGVATLAGCTSNDDDNPGDAANVSTGGGGDNAAAGKQITIGFSAPAADHGWIGAITRNARAQAGTHTDVTLKATEGTNDLNLQISQVETLINEGVDVLVILPHDGKALTEVARKAMIANIPVINLDRVFDSSLAYRTWIGGDNYGMGVAAGNYIAGQLKAKGVSNPVIAEIPGIDSLPLTQQRSQGFKDALATAGFKVGPRVPAEFTVESGERSAANLLQAAPRIDALWNHDDDQGIGVLSAIDSAGRDEFFLVGGAGSKDVMDLIKADDGVVKATVTYPPTMASSAINLARLVAQGKTLSDLVENDVPSSITLASVTVTKDNVDRYLKFGFAS